MELSLFIAKLVGAVYIALGLGMLINFRFYKKMFTEMLKDETFLFGWSVFALIIGLTIILHHNVWEWSWVVIITIVGWAGFVKGVLLMVFPSWVKMFKPWFANKGFLMATGVGCLILGGAVSYLGWYM